jgi:hypothetical protein
LRSRPTRHEERYYERPHLLEGNVSFQPEEVEELAAAYEQVLRKLSLVKRNDALTRLVAKEIIQLAELGVRERDQLTRLVLKNLK